MVRVWLEPEPVSVAVSQVPPTGLTTELVTDTVKPSGFEVDTIICAELTPFGEVRTTGVVTALITGCGFTVSEVVAEVPTAGAPRAPTVEPLTGTVQVYTPGSAEFRTPEVTGVNVTVAGTAVGLTWMLLNKQHPLPVAVPSARLATGAVPGANVTPVIATNPATGAGT